MPLKVFMTSTTGVGVTAHQIRNFFVVKEVKLSDDKSRCSVKLENGGGHRVMLQFQMASPNDVAARRWHHAFALFLQCLGLAEISDTDELLGRGLQLHDIDYATAFTVLTSLPDVLWAVSPE